MLIASIFRSLNFINVHVKRDERSREKKNPNCIFYILFLCTHVIKLSSNRSRHFRCRVMERKETMMMKKPTNLASKNRWPFRMTVKYSGLIWSLEWTLTKTAQSKRSPCRRNVNRVNETNVEFAFFSRDHSRPRRNKQVKISIRSEQNF